MARDVEQQCVNDVRRSLRGSSDLKIEKANCSISQIKKHFDNCRSSEQECRFPDFVFDGGVIEHFIVTSSFETKGSDYKIFEATSEREKAEFFKAKNDEFFSSQPIPNTLTVVTKESKYGKGTYKDFLLNFKKHFDGHIVSLGKSAHTNDIVIFLVEQQGGKLCVYENGVFHKFYCLSEDRNVLLYLKDAYPKVNYVVFKSVDSVEIIDLSNIDKLITEAKDHDDIRAGRILDITVGAYINI